LVVENDSRWRRDHERNLREWGYQIFTAEGIGPALLENAKAKAQKHRCHIAVVNMRLCDNLDRNDHTGLDLASELAPTEVIIVSGHGDLEAVRRALRENKLFDFVGKEEGPERLHQSIEQAAHETCACRNDLTIVWSHELSSAKIAAMLFPDDLDIPPDEADDLIRRLFPKARSVSLELITGAPQTSDSKPSAVRRRSLVFKAIVDRNPTFFLIKLARANKVEIEVNHFEEYVKFKLKDLHRPELIAHRSLWDVGGVAYTFLGDVDALGMSQTFAALYRGPARISLIQRSLQHFFDDNSWGNWYKSGVVALIPSLFDAYDITWDGALRRALEQWSGHDRVCAFPGLSSPLPNPTYWLARHYRESEHVVAPRQAVTHGDLHGDNLFVDRTGHAWPIDFERTGPGPILRDYVELSQDIFTRLALVSPEDLSPLYELAVVLSAPASTAAPLQETPAIQQNIEANKAFQLLKALRRIAHKQTRYTDYREYLWGLLLDSLFVASLLPADNMRRTKALLLASVICGRLDHWNANRWPPHNWPPVAGLMPNEAQPTSTASESPIAGRRGKRPHNAQEYQERHEQLTALARHLTENIVDLQSVQDHWRRRLHALQVRHAAQGSNTPVEVLTEIEDITQTIDRYRQQLQGIEQQHEEVERSLDLLKRNWHQSR
jgi:DNA-binding NarL/FixJ family response regulator